VACDYLMMRTAALDAVLKLQLEANHTIHDAAPGHDTQVELAITARNQAVTIEADGYSVCNMDDTVPIGKGHRPVVALEIWEGQFRVIVWSDINEEDPEHIIDLADAKISNRKEA
jgi:hypothetical protein